MKIIPVLLGLPIGLAAGFDGAEQILVFRVLWRHADRGLRMIQGVNPISEAKVGPGVERMPVRVVYRNPVESIQRVIKTAGENKLRGRP